ncbi:MAG: YhbY family RNA-binding protein [Nanoarchaeota archaeon]
MPGTIKLQIGKNKLSPGFFQTLENAFKKRENVKISVLKSANHSKENMNKISEEILKKLGDKFTSRIIGFTICLKKWRKKRV